MRKALLAVAAALMVAFVAAGCGSSDNKNAETLNKGQLLVGSDIPYAPFEFGQPPYKGFDVDIVNAISKKLNLKTKFQKTVFDTIFRDLAQKKFDMVASSATITPERQKQVSFSDPYFPADQSLLVKKGSPIKNTSQLDGKIVGAQSGTTGADYAKGKTKAKTVRTYEQIDDAFNALEAGQVDAVINDFPISKYATQSKKDLVLVQSIPTGEKYGLAFAKSSNELRDKVNGALQDIKDDGTYTQIYKKWFQVDPPKSILGQ